MIMQKRNLLFPTMRQLCLKKVRNITSLQLVVSAVYQSYVFLYLVLQEVESKVEKFRNQLRSRLSILPIPLKEMRRHIK